MKRKNLQPEVQDDTPPQILVVDDSTSVRYAMQKSLTEAGMIVTLASDGEEGLARAMNSNFDLIITDIDMPKMDGFELCTRLKEEFKTSHIPIIVLSTHDSDEHVEEGFRVGVDAYLSKSGNIEENIERIKDILTAKNFLTGSKILVVDDSSSVCLFLEKELREEGFIVQTAENGKAAFDMLPLFKPDLILSDLMMPEMDGGELCRTIKKSVEFCTIPIVIMSSLADKALMRRLMREGVATYLIKPFSVTQLSIVIEEIFSSNFRLLLEEKERLTMEDRKSVV